MKVREFRKYIEKKELVDWFNNLLKERIKKLGMYEDDIKEIYEQATKDIQLALDNFNISVIGGGK